MRAGQHLDQSRGTSPADQRGPRGRMARNRREYERRSLPSSGSGGEGTGRQKVVLLPTSSVGMR